MLLVRSARSPRANWAEAFRSMAARQDDQLVDGPPSSPSAWDKNEWTWCPRAYPTRISCRFGGTSGQVVLDQIRTVDQSRLVKKLGRLDSRTSLRVLEVLQELFAP